MNLIPLRVLIAWVGLIFLCACEFIKYPQLSGAYSLAQMAVYTDESFKELFGFPENLEIDNRMSHFANAFDHKLKFTSKQRDTQTVIPLDKLVRVDTGSYPNDFFDGFIIDFKEGDRAGVFCQTDYYTMIFADPEKWSPSPDYIRDMYKVHQPVLDEKGDVLLDQYGQPVMASIPKDVTTKDPPIDEEIFDKWVIALEKADGITMPLSIFRYVDSITSGCIDDVFPLLEYAPGGAAAIYKAARNDLELVRNPALYSWDDFAPEAYPARLFFSPPATGISVKSRIRTGPDIHEKALTAFKSKNRILSKKIRNAVDYGASDTYRKRLVGQAPNACGLKCPAVMVSSRPSGASSDQKINRYYYVQLAKDGEPLVAAVSIKGLPILPVAKGFGFDTLTNDAKGNEIVLSAVGVIGRGKKPDGGNRFATRESKMGHLIRAIEAVAESIHQP